MRTRTLIATAALTIAAPVVAFGGGYAQAQDGTCSTTPITWNGDQLLVSTSPPYATGVQVPAGEYNLMATTRDAYPERVNVVQLNEQIYVKVGNATSGVSNDLQDQVASAETTSDLGTITTSGGELIILHIAQQGIGTDNTNSVRGAQIVLTPQCPEPPPPTTTVVATTTPPVPTTPPPATTAPPVTTAAPPVPTPAPTTTVAVLPPAPTTPPPATPPSQGLPVTGSENTAMAIIGALALLGGAAMIGLTRRGAVDAAHGDR